MTSVFQFDAFLSYNRRDIEFATALEKALERYRIPRSVRPDQRRLKVFRDTDDMTGTDYDKAIRRHLDASRKLIVVCSPNARGSQFVDDEIAYFIEGHSPESVIPVMIDGIANNEAGDEALHAFPPALASAMGMPLAADYRAWRGGSPRRREFRGQWYGILADLLGTTREDIEERDRKYRAARRRTAGAIAAVVVATIAVLANNWWSAHQVSRAQDQLRQAVSTEDPRERALALSEMANMVDVDGVLPAALETGMALSRPTLTDHPGDYADLYWRDRIEGRVNDRIRPLAAASPQAGCEFRLPEAEFVTGLTSPDGSVDAFLHGGKLFVQNADGTGAALVYCLRQTDFVDTSAGTSRWRSGTESVEGRMAFGTADAGPAVMVKDTGEYILTRVSPLRPGRHLLALANVAEARFRDDGRLEFTVAGMPQQSLRLPPSGSAAQAATDCIDYDGPERAVADILADNGFAGYEGGRDGLYVRLRACYLDGGSVLAYVTNSLAETGYMGLVAAIDAETRNDLFTAYSDNPECTAFARDALSYCRVGDLSGNNITAEAGFVRFDGGATVHAIEDEAWSRRLAGHSAASPDRARLLLWGSVWQEDPVDRPVVLWPGDRPGPAPVVLDRSPSPVEAAAFSPGGDYALVLRADGALKVFSFDVPALLRELGERAAPLE